MAKNLPFLPFFASSCRKLVKNNYEKHVGNLCREKKGKIFLHFFCRRFSKNPEMVYKNPVFLFFEKKFFSSKLFQ
tara:strand:+ start:129 stop:353 length:225 start_codon:yes stop_codon:yes gene_type:complete